MAPLTPTFPGKVALITGGGMGLGRAFAEALSAHGATVAVADVDSSAADEVSTAIRTDGGSAVPVHLDVGDTEAISTAIEAITDELGGIDILVNNAARHAKKYNQGFGSLSHDEIRGLFDVNVLGIISCSLACKATMTARGGGVIVNMASAAGYMGTTPYGVTKVAVRGLTIALATELAPAGIRVNAIAPTITPTEGVLAEYSSDDIERSVRARQLIRRPSSVADIVNTLLFLCSENASFITGETIRVTGGASLTI